jgi:hypothetical protein
MPPGPIAPGADDNASGTAAVIEAARIFSQYSFPYTVIYALWDEEEIGLLGSGYYAELAANQGDSILGVINLDMIAWDSDSDYVAEIHTSNIGNTIYLGNKMLQVNSDYNIGLNMEVHNPGMPNSDHYSFWINGYGAILLIEDLGDFNLYWHTPDDKVIYFNQDYFLKMSKVAIGALATFSLNYDIKILHTPIASRDSTTDIETTAKVVSGLDIGTGQNTPRLYYRINDGSGWSTFYEVVGSLISNKNYSFTIPGQELNTKVDYYLAAQDEDSILVVTFPPGGSGFSPPGNIPPNNFFRFYVAVSSIAFADSAMSLDNWNSTEGWDVTIEKFTSTPFSFTDSPGGNYPINSSATLTSIGSIDLKDTIGIVGAVLEFQAQWDIEEDWDYAQVLISTNSGIDWTPLEGQYTNLGASGTSQPEGEPLYDGALLTWVQESMDLGDYLGEEIKLRFLLKSDGFVIADGFYVDDVIVNILIITDVEPIALAIKDFKLYQNYPNPFNPNTTIKFALPEPGFVTLKIYNVLGEELTVLVSEQLNAGSYTFDWNATGLPSGIYLYRLKAGSYIDTKKMTLLK